MAVFNNCSVLLELKSLSFKEKKKLKSAITENGGTISFVVNKQCSLVVTGDVSGLSSNRLRSIEKHQTPVVGVDYVLSCVERGVLLPADGFKLDASSPSSAPLPPSPPRQAPPTHRVSKAPTSKAAVSKVPTSKPVPEPPKEGQTSLTQRAEPEDRSGMILEKFRIYTEADSNLPPYPDDFQVAKYSMFEKINSNTWYVLELQSCTGEEGRQYRVVRYRKDDAGDERAAVKETLAFPPTSEEAVALYQTLRDSLEASGVKKRSSGPPQAQDLGSAPLQQLLLEEKLNTGSLPQWEVGVFVELLWTEALGRLRRVLRAPVNQLSLSDVSRVEGLLLQAQKKLWEEKHPEVTSLLRQVYALLPLGEPLLLCDAKFISNKLDLCQLIRDVLNVSEMTLRNPAPSSLGKYRALRCSIEAVPRGSSEFQLVTNLLLSRKLQIQQILRVSRGVELQTFKSELGNVQSLLHSSRPSNFVGILSRGLLLPHVGVEHHGIERTDVGNLGSGIYFSDARRLRPVGLKYSRPSATDGSRLLLVCDVALGRCKDVRRRDLELTRAPEGYHSVHGVRSSRGNDTDFMDDEYVVYSPDQVKLKYVVQFLEEGDELRDFSPTLDMSTEPSRPPCDPVLGSEDDGVEDVKNPLDDVTAGLLDGSGQRLPLQAVHVKCRLMDLLSQVVIFQKYTNLSAVPIEAKYVFPLDDAAAVCGFEAFINGKHVVGQVKEKEAARREYKQAIEKGHGAYLMDQDAPDVFTISVGNLPPGATVLIKVTFVSELIVRDGSVLFSLPGSVAPWQESAALNQTTQVTVEKVCVTDEAASTRDFTLDMSVEMPNEISGLQCITHKVKMKKTACKAVVSVLPGEVMGPEGFQLSITLLEVHLPRMWVEQHPDKDSQACMLVFYPDFEVASRPGSDEVVLLLDTSESMKGESLLMAQRIALQVLKHLDRTVRLNVVLFGTDHTEAFLMARPLADARQTAESFIKRSSPVGGSTELWRPLRALSLLPPSRGVRNLLLLSDGHIQNPEATLQLLRDGARHSRLFTCGLSPTANRHMLRALARAGGGAYEFFDTKTKHTWAEKVERQVKRMASPGCSSVSVKWQQFNPTAPPPVQAPRQLHALFNDCHALVFGFVPHCTQATLLGNLRGQELETMVSTTELQKTTGTFLHKLTARALIRDYEDGSLDPREAEHEGQKAELKSFIVELSKEFSILSQFTSFVAVEERDSERAEDGFTDIPKLIGEEDVDFLPYISWTSPEDEDERLADSSEEDDTIVDSSDDDMGFGLFSPTIDLGVVDVDVGSPCYSPTSPALRDSLTLQSLVKGEAAPQKHKKSKRLPSEDEELEDEESEDEEMDFSPAVDSCFQFLGAHTAICKLPTPPPPPQNQLLGSEAPRRYRASFRALESARLAPPPPPPPPPAPPAPGSSPPPLLLGSAPPPLLLGSAPRPLLPGSAPPPPLGWAPPPLLLGSAPRPLPPCGLGPPPPLGWAPPPLPPCGLAPPPPPPHPAASPPHQPPRASVVFGLEEVLPVCSEPPPPPSAQRYIPPFGGRPGPAAAAAFRSVKACGEASGFGATSSSAGPAAAPLQLSLDSFVGRHRPQDGGGGGFSFGSGRSAGFRRMKSDIQGFHEAMQQSLSSEEGRPPAGDALSPRARPISAKMGRPAEGLVSAKGIPPHVGSYSGASPLQARCLSLRATPESSVAESPRFVWEGGPHSARCLPLQARRHRFIRSAELADPESPKPKWTKIFEMQHSEGYWELTTALGELINVDVDLFANEFLKKKGIQSLGVKAHADVLRLLASLLVLQLMRVEKLEEGKLLRTLFSLQESSRRRPERWEELKKAVDWVRWADRQYPCVYSRLEFGLSWESSTRQLLGYEGLPPFSPLSGLDLQRTPVPVLVH